MALFDKTLSNCSSVAGISTFFMVPRISENMRRIKVTFFSLTSRRISAAVIGMGFLLNIYDYLRLPNRDQRVTVLKQSAPAGGVHCEVHDALPSDSRLSWTSPRVQHIFS